MSDFRVFLEKKWAHYQNQEATKAKIDRVVAEYDFFCKNGLNTDSNFEAELCRDDNNQFDRRGWEITLGNHLLRQGFEVTSHDKGPDFRVVLPNGKVVWVEATAPDAGSGDNAIIQPKWHEYDEPREAVSLDNDAILARWTQGFNDKNRKYEKVYHECISDGEGFVIAINGLLLGAHGLGFDGRSGLPAAIDAVYGTSRIMVTFQSDGSTYRHLDHSMTVDKKKGEPIPIVPFLYDNHNHVSGVIATYRHLGDIDDTPMVLVHNMQASAPVEKNALGMTNEYWVEGTNEEGFTVRDLQEYQKEAA